MSRTFHHSKFADRIKKGGASVKRKYEESVRIADLYIELPIRKQHMAIK